MSVVSNGRGLRVPPGPAVDEKVVPEEAVPETVARENGSRRVADGDLLTEPAVGDDTITLDEPEDAAPPAGHPRRSWRPRRRPRRRRQPMLRPDGRRRLTAGRWLLLLALTLALTAAGALAGNAVADRLPVEYGAHADLIYPLTQEQPTGFLRQDRSLSTQQVLLDSRTVLGPVAQKFGVDVDDLQEAVTSEVVSDSEIIRVQLTDTSRAQARKMLTAVVTQYLAVANNPARSSVRTYLATQLKDVQSRLATARKSTLENQSEINALVQLESTLQAQLDETQLTALTGPTPRITVPPYVEHDRISPKPLLVVGGGALAGLVIALVTVALLARRMTRPLTRPLTASMGRPPVRPMARP